MLTEHVASSPSTLERKAGRLSLPIILPIDWSVGRRHRLRVNMRSMFRGGYGYELLILHQIASFAPYFAIANISALLFVILSQQLYIPTALVSLSSQLRGVVFGWMVLLLIILLTLFLLKISANLSRGALTMFGVLGLATLLTSRFFHCSCGAGFAD